MKKWFTIGLLVLAANSAYIFAVHPPTVFYMGNVLVHLLLGTLLLGAAAFQLRRTPMLATFVVAGLVGIYLAVAGNTRDHHWALWIHIALAIAALPLLRRRSFAIAAAVIVVAGGFRLLPHHEERIRNPSTAPLSMNEEGGGPKSPFFPSSLKTDVGGTIPADFFMDSKGCGECHQQIYKEWNSSAHHFASFNNQFYRSRSSTCRMLAACNRASGARAATIMRC